VIWSAVVMLTGSIFPVMAWHALNNVLGLLAGHYALDLASLPAGTYFLRVRPFGWDATGIDTDYDLAAVAVYTTAYLPIVSFSFICSEHPHPPPRSTKGLSYSVLRSRDS
jgi:hypothetical protein